MFGPSDTYYLLIVIATARTDIWKISECTFPLQDIESSQRLISYVALQKYVQN